MRTIFFTGKGGVGKTSIAAATACRLAEAGQEVLIMSTDQAHSLSDSFEQPIGCEETLLAPHLYGLEIDVVRENEAAWGKLQAYLQALLTVKSEQLLEAEELLVFPGLEELFALLKVLEIKESGRYDVLIVDCAPTGETLSLLRFPEMFGQLVEKVLPVKRKAAKIAGPAVSRLTQIPMPKDEVFDEIERLTKRLEQLKAFMSDSAQVTLRLVTTTERIVIRETKRSFTWLHLYGYPVDAVIVNRLYPPKALAGYFAAWQPLQEQGLRDIRESFSGRPIFTLELQAQELKGKAALLQAAEALYGEQDPLPVLASETIFTLKREAKGYRLTWSLPFADKADLDITQQGDELVVGVENGWRRLLLPEPVRGRTVVKAIFQEGLLTLWLE